jgi:tetratricopeptide (TPR) repeat protein
LHVLGDLQGAKVHFERALRIGEATFGSDHHAYATRLNNLANVLKDLGDLQGAKDHIESALGILRRFLWDDHPTTKLVQQNLASVLRAIEEKESGGGSGE